MKYILAPWVTLLCCVGMLSAQLPQNAKGGTLLDKGIRMMDAGSYAEAARLLDQAVALPPHQASSTATYLSGLAHYYLKQYDVAVKRFEDVMRHYPHSRYRDEAIYHKGMALLYQGDPTASEQGLYDLFFSG